MQTIVNEEAYLQRLAESLKKITFDWANGELFSFEAIFYPLEIDEGRYAFQSYADQMEIARRHAETGSAGSPRWESSRSERETQNWLMPPLLWNEDEYAPGSLVVPEAADSRILAVASAGHGKTTLLRRIALYYCQPGSRDPAHLEIGEKYRLCDAPQTAGEWPIPCLIRLRDISTSRYSVPQLLEESLFSVFARDSDRERLDGGALTEQIRTWIDSVRGRLLLLVDGLDELSGRLRYFFLLALDDYLDEYPDTRVIMTSRAAGLSENRVQNVLQKMWFRGRSILPLADEQAEQYAMKWITVTQPEDQQKQMRSAVTRIMTQDRFRYLKEFMRTPLELLLILKQTVNDSFSVNRFQMFNDTLWEVFTNHEKGFRQKRAIFEDTMTLLSFLAYQMQLRNSMYLSSAELEQLEESIEHLSFHTNLVENGSFWDVLDSLAANVGIVERDDRTEDVAYTFPIRAYQEFLTAHACCHLRLNGELSRPYPSGILQHHLDDSRWINIINFALSDLSTTNQREFDRIIKLLFQTVTNAELLRAVVEADLLVTREHAEILCRNAFRDRILSPARRDLLVAAVGTKSGYAYSYALKSLYGENAGDYLEAYALSAVLREYTMQGSAYEKALHELCSCDARRIALGAEMISLMARAAMDEISDAYRPIVTEDLRISQELVVILANNARNYGDLSCVAALTDLWVSRMDGYELAGRILSAEHKQMAVQALEAMVEEAGLYHPGDVKNVREEYLPRLQQLVRILGTFPVTEEIMAHGEGNPVVCELLLSMLSVVNPDPVAVAAALLFYTWSLPEFRSYWGIASARTERFAAERERVFSPRIIHHLELINQALDRLDGRK